MKTMEETWKKIEYVCNGKDALYDMVRKYGITDLKLSETEKMINAAVLTEEDIRISQYRGITFHDDGDYPTFWEAVKTVTNHNEKMSKMYHEFRAMLEARINTK